MLQISAYEIFMRSSMVEIRPENVMKKELPWHIVEASIFREKRWLLDVFDFSEFNRTDQVVNSDSPISLDEMLRQISISIIRGNITAKEFKSEQINGLWTDKLNWQLEEHEERHGGEWHRAMMGIVKAYFIKEGFEVINEPDLNQGRADLGIYRENHQNLFVEIGTTSLFKTWINLHGMPNTTFLFVPSVNYALEFKTKNVTTFYD